MKNNSLVFLGFLIICLVNLSAKSRDNHPPVHPAPAAAMKMAALPPEKEHLASDLRR